MTVSKIPAKMAPKDSGWHKEAHGRAVAKKTHVSFPQLKYPSLRDKGLKDPVQWIMGKALDDGAEGLWRIHDKLYDVSDFIKMHPGGEEWLQITKGTDITEAFEVHHLKPSAKKLLHKFFIRSATTPRNSPFTFKDDGFYKTLKAKVVEELKNVPKDVSKSSDMITDGTLVTLLLLSVLSCWVNIPWLANIFWLVAGLSMCGLCACSHNYIHRQNNWRMFLFNTTMSSYRDFRISHALSHHLYPNTLMDLEISMFEPLFPWIPRRGKGAYSKVALLVELLIFPLLFFWNFINKVILIFTREGFFTQHVRWHDFVGLALPVWMFLVSGEPMWKVVKIWLCINMTASFFFHMIGLSAAHHHPDIFHDGDQVDTVTPDWGMHELEAVMDRTDITGNLFAVMTFFGDHALHHQFPTLDHAVLPYLYPVFLDHCKIFFANFRVTSSMDLFLRQVKQLVRTEPKLLSEKNKK